MINYTINYFMYIILILSSKYVAGSELYKSSLTFVIDDTGSMEDDIDQVKLAANAIFDTVLNHNKSQIANFLLVTFNDLGYGVGKEASDISSVSVNMALATALNYRELNLNKNHGVYFRTNTTDRDEFKKALSDISIHDGGDCPEYSMAGIKRALEESLPRSQLYIFTDASAKDFDQYEDVKSIAQKKQCQLVFALTGICGTTNDPDYKVYHKIADATDGEVFHLTKTEVGKILEYVKKSITGRRTTLAAKTLSPGEHNITFKADVIMGEIMLSLSSAAADNPAVDVIAPDGSDVWKKILFTTDQIKVYSIDVSMPGVHTVKVNSKEETRAKVSATSGIDFQHGFSKFKLSSIVDTSSRPAPGVKSHLSIKLNEGDIELQAVQILDMDDRVKMNLTLELLNNKTKLYTTEPFDPPTTMFRVMIIGYDPKSKSNITREALTPVEPQKLIRGAKIENKGPTVSIEGEDKITLEYDQPLQLVCKVNGYPQPKIVWKNKEKGTVISDETSVLELPYDYLSILNLSSVHENATYECEATNSLGTDAKHVTVLTIILKKFNILATPKSIKVKYGKEGKIECKVDAYPPAHITWYKNGEELKTGGNIEISSNKSILIIKHAKRSDKGKYICEASNIDETKLITKRVFVEGLEAPFIDRRTPTNVTVKIDSPAVLECKILRGNPKPSISWYRIYGQVSEEMIEMSEWENSEKLIVKSANKLDTGMYLCQARNEISRDYRDINLIVEYPPSIEEDVELIETTVGRDVSIPCQADGGPPPEVTWSKDGVKLPNTYRIRIYRDHTLKFKAQSTDSGYYSCTATNSLGSTSRTVKVDVDIAASIKPPVANEKPVIKGRWLTLPCEATGNPQPDIKWIYRSFDTTSLSEKIIKPSTETGELQISDVQVNQEGFYTCVATNSGGSTNITYSVVVYESPKIVNKHSGKRFVAVEGDRSLRLTCEATGNPRPTFTWTKDGLNLASGSTYYIEGGTLAIRNVPKDAEGIYSCYADNPIGSDEDEYEVKVHLYPSSSRLPTSSVMVARGQPATIECPLTHQLTDQLRWYKNGILIRQGELSLTNVSLEDSGTYTCRVVDFFKSESANVRVTVGDKPRFTSEEDENIEMVDGMNLNCENEGVPKPDVLWYHNGRKLNWTEPEYFLLGTDSPGQYRCEVKNSLGHISRIFNVTHRDCFVNIRKLTKLQPLMLSSSLTWPMFEKSQEFIVFLKGEEFILFCPNKFKNFSRQYITAFCDGGMNVLVNGNKYDYSDIQCTEEVNHIVQRTGEKCMSGNTEKMIISYKELLKFGSQMVYEVCWDKTNHVPIYAKHKMQSSLADDEYETDWSDRDQIRMNPEEGYDCKTQNTMISSWLRRWFQETDQCCFSRRQLVNPRDVFPGIPQKATYSYLNVVPHWSTCNTGNWDDIERRVRNFARNSFDLTVWTGTAKVLSLRSSDGMTVNDFFTDRRGNKQPVPMFLWKVIQDPVTSSSLAIIQVNVPDLLPSEVSKYILCNDVCDYVEWMRSSNWHDLMRGYTYCCTLEEFETEFRLSGVFEPGMASLLRSDASLLPESSLTIL